MQSRQSFRSKQPRSRTKGRGSASPLAAHCLQVVDLCLLGILFVAPLFFGGRHLLGRLVFIALASIAGVAWFTHQALLKQAKWTRTWANVLGLAALLLVTLQILPLAVHSLGKIAPRNTSLLTLWNQGVGVIPSLGEWRTLSLDPSSTKIALATLLAYVLLFITAAGRLQKLTDIERLLRGVALAAILMGSFGILQYFTSNGLYFWFYEYPFSTTSLAAKGSFTTKNHFAHFLVLGVGPLLAWVVLHLRRVHKSNNDQSSTARITTTATTMGLYAGLGIVALAVLLSFSRGGILVLLVATTIAVTIFYRRGLLSSSYLYGLAMLGVVVLGLLSLSGYDRVVHRLGHFTSGSLEQLDNNEGRRKIWAANVEAIQTGSLFGSGAGTHREIYPVYFPQSTTLEHTHAENGYLQVATENGLLGIGLLLLMVMMVGLWCWQALRHAPSNQALILAGAVTASLAISLIHSVVDFVWFIPACMSLTILLAACSLRLAQLTTTELTTDLSSPLRSLTPWTRSRWIGLAATTACAAVWAISTVIGPASASLHWDKYMLTNTANRHPTLRLAATDASPQDDPAHQQACTEAMIYHLQKTLSQNPLSARAHLRLASKTIQLFEQRQLVSDNSMSIDQIREAALASQFASAQSLRKWLVQAFGENSRLLYRAHYHARQALRLCPLQGEGYLYLANLCFLEGHTTPVINAYLEQSLQVRPHSGRVLFEIGRQRLLLGQVEEGFGNWQQIYNDTGAHQQQIIRLLAGQLPAAGFLDIFEPTWSTLQPLWKQYRQAGNPDDWQAILDYTTAVAKKNRAKQSRYQAAHIRHALGDMHQVLNRPEQSLAYFQQAFQISPNVYAFRRSLGRALLRANQYHLAVPHLRWCLARNPGNESLQEELILATKSRLPQTASTSSNPMHR